MRAVRFFPPVALILLLAVGSMVLSKDQPAPAQNPVTVGEFALKVVKQALDDPDLTKAMTADQAISRLQQAGLQLKGTAGDTLSASDKSAYFMAVASGLVNKLNSPPLGFDQCAQLPKTTDCRACCMALGASNKQCGKACGQAHADLQHASPSEPTP
jgi:hypothetical protein